MYAIFTVTDSTTDSPDKMKIGFKVENTETALSLGNLKGVRSVKHSKKTISEVELVHEEVPTDGEFDRFDEFVKWFGGIKF